MQYLLGTDDGQGVRGEEAKPEQKAAAQESLRGVDENDYRDSK